jgi:hypothetical protein
MIAGRKANFGAQLFLGIVLFQIIMYLFVFYANQEENVGQYDDMNSTIGGVTSTSDISIVQARSWTDGFNVSVFNLPDYVNIFYVTFQIIILALSIYMLIRGI